MGGTADVPLTTNHLPLSRKARIAKPHVRWYNSFTLTLPCKAAGMPRERSNRMKILVFGSLNIGHIAAGLAVAPCDCSAIRFHLSLLPSLTFHELSQLLFL